MFIAKLSQTLYDQVSIEPTTSGIVQQPLLKLSYRRRRQFHFSFVYIAVSE